MKRKSRKEEEEQLSSSTNNSRDIIIIDLNYQVTQMVSLYLCYNCLFFARLVAKDSHSRIDKIVMIEYIVLLKISYMIKRSFFFLLNDDYIYSCYLNLRLFAISTTAFINQMIIVTINFYYLHYVLHMY